MSDSCALAGGGDSNGAAIVGSAAGLLPLTVCVYTLAWTCVVVLLVGSWGPKASGSRGRFKV